MCNKKELVMNEQFVPMQVIAITHEVLKRVANGSLDEGPVVATLQSLIEKQRFENSSLSNKAIDTHDGVGITELFLSQTMTFQGQQLKRHRNGGGWVPVDQDSDDLSKPHVAESAYVGPFAMVYGDALVFDHAQVYGNARIYGGAMVYGNAQVYGNARVHGDAQVYGNARVHGDAQVYGDARVHGDAQVFDRTKIAGELNVF
ncbi:MAG: hypothetical protein ABIR91_01505 [Candidatus Saccharimonadales bacterium]